MSFVAAIGTRAATVLPLVAAAALGALWSRRWRGLERGLAAVVLAFGAASVSLSLVGGAASVFGRSWLRPPAGPLLAAALIGIALVAGRPLARRPPDRDPGPPLARPGAAEAAALVLGVLAVAFAAVVAVIHPPGGYDGLSFHLPLGLDFFRHGNLTGPLGPLQHAMVVGDRRPQFSLAYPGGAELVEGAILGSLGEHAVSLYQLPFGVAIALGVGRFAQELGARPWWSIGAVLAAPIVLFQSGQEGTDLVVGACLVSAFVFGACGPVRRDRFLLASLSLGLALSVKLIVMPLLMVLAVAMLWRLSRASGERRRLAAWLAPMAGIAILPVAAWWIRDLAVFSNPVYPLRVRLLGLTLLPGEPTSAFGGGEGGNFVPTPWAWPLYPLFEKYTGASGFGALLVVGAVPGLALAAWRRWRTGRAALAWWAALTAVSLAVAVVLPLPTPRRQLVPGLLALAFVGLIAPLLPDVRRWERALVLAALALTVAVAVDQFRPIASAPLDRAAFYEREWYVEPRAASLGPTAVVFDDVTWSELGYPAVYALEGSGHDQVVVTGSLGGAPPRVACRRLPPGTTHVYVVSPVGTPPSTISRTYGPPSFRLRWSVVRPDPRGRDRRTLFDVTAPCRAAARP